jgi:hypothetical protein
VGKGSTDVQVTQTAVQNQETNINTVKDLNGTIAGLIGVLSEQAKNPAANYVVPVTVNAPATATEGQEKYQNSDLVSLLTTMYLLDSQTPKAAASGSENGLNIVTVLLFGAVVIIAIFVFRR